MNFRTKSCQSGSKGNIIIHLNITHRRELRRETRCTLSRQRKMEYAEFHGFGPRMTNKPNRCHTKKVKHATP